MNKNTKKDTAALERYHRLYDNGAYKTLCQSILREYGETVFQLDVCNGSEEYERLSNQIIDSALEICGAEQHKDAHIRLAIRVIEQKISAYLCADIRDYLCRFQESGQIMAGEFMQISQTLRSTEQAIAAIRVGTESASDIHSWRGRSAYHLLRASEALLLAAQATLQQREMNYADEKFRSAEKHLSIAKEEGAKHKKDFK